MNKCIKFFEVLFYIISPATCYDIDHVDSRSSGLRWLNTVSAVSECMSFAKLWQEKGCSSQAETWQVENILMKDFDLQVKFDIFVVSMAT